MPYARMLRQGERDLFARRGDKERLVPQCILASHCMDWLACFIFRNWSRREAISSQPYRLSASLQVEIEKRQGFIDALEEILHPGFTLTCRHLRISLCAVRFPIVQFIGKRQERPPVWSKVGRSNEDARRRGEWRLGSGQAKADFDSCFAGVVDHSQRWVGAICTKIRSVIRVCGCVRCGGLYIHSFPRGVFVEKCTNGVDWSKRSTPVRCVFPGRARRSIKMAPRRRESKANHLHIYARHSIFQDRPRKICVRLRLRPTLDHLK